MTDSDHTPSVTARDAAAAAETPPFKDRRAGLVVFGIVLLLMALASLGSAGLQLVMLFGSGAQALPSTADSSIFVFTSIFYLLIAAATAWLGVGSIRCRRWARALLLVLSALTLATGVLSSAYLVSFFGSLSEMLQTQAGDDEAAAIVPFVLGCAVVFVAFLYLILPGAFFLFYRSPHVKATCEHYDPKPRWTDRYPAPLLAGIVVLLFSALVLLAPVLGTPTPFFGAFLTGVPAWIYALVTGLFGLALAAGFLRRDRRAWLGSLAFFALTGTSAWLSFRGDGILRMYERMGYPPELNEQLEAFALTRGLSAVMLISLVAVLVFFGWLGRYFPAREVG